MDFQRENGFNNDIFLVKLIDRGDDHFWPSAILV